MNERTNRLLDAMGELPPEFVEEAAPKAEIKRPHRYAVPIAAAACAALVLGSTMFLHSRGGLDRPPEMPLYYPEVPADTNDGVYIPPIGVSLDRAHEENACMVSFFIYEGRIYEGYQWDTQFPHGEKLGTAVGLIDEWTPEEGYVELAGSVEGDFYAVEGYDPGFLLYVEEGKDGYPAVYVNNSGMTIKTGADLFEDKLHLSDDLLCVRWETQASWDKGDEQFHGLPLDAPELQRFLAALNDAPCVREEDVPFPDDANSIFDEGVQLYHMEIMKSDGLTVRLRLFAGGYVQFDGIRVCFQVEERAFNELINVLENT